jgi:hypothetical protein
MLSDHTSTEDGLRRYLRFKLRGASGRYQQIASASEVPLVGLSNWRRLLHTQLEKSQVDGYVWYYCGSMQPNL